jgi:hypothetical protein
VWRRKLSFASLNKSWWMISPVRTLDALFVNLLKKVIPQFCTLVRGDADQIGQPNTVRSETYSRELHVAVGSFMTVEPILEPARP